MAEDWWSAASASAASLLTTTASFARLNSNAGSGSRSAAPSNASADPLLAGLSRVSSRSAPPTTALPAPRHERIGACSPGIPPSPPTIVLYELVERATGHGREGHVDPGAQRRVLASVRSRVTPVGDVLRALVAGSDSLADAPYNASVLHFVHLLLDAGPRALCDASYDEGGRGPPAMRVVADVHRSARRSGDVLAPAPLRVALEAGPAPEGRPSLAAGVELYALLLSRRIAFAERAPEIEANYSLDRWYRRLSIEKVADDARDATNSTRLARILSPETAAELLGLVRIAIAALAALRRGRAQKNVLSAVLAEACNAYVFSEYVRSKNSGPPPREVAKGLRDIALTIATDWKRDAPTALDGGIPAVLAHGSQIDAAVANEVLALSGPRDMARSIRIDSRHRRDIVCSFSSFAGLHQALNPALKTTGGRVALVPQRATA